MVYLCDVCGYAGHDVSVSVPGKKDRSVAYQFLPMLLYGYLIICDGTVNGWHADHWSFSGSRSACTCRHVGRRTHLRSV